MERATTVYELPTRPAVYAMYERVSRGESTTPVYVGIASNLKARIGQHLIRRDSSITTGASALSINPDRVGEVRWWDHPAFLTDAGERHGKTRETMLLQAAEIIASDMLRPAYVSRGRPQHVAHQFSQEPAFRAAMAVLFQGAASGRLMIPTLQDALVRIEQLEHALAGMLQRIALLEQASTSTEGASRG